MVNPIYWLFPRMAWWAEKHPRAATNPEAKPYCCALGCSKDAGFSIHGSTGHFEDVTEACESHVGALLGTPAWLPKQNDHWLVYPIEVNG